jgi:hypothetical protein
MIPKIDVGGKNSAASSWLYSTGTSIGRTYRLNMSTTQYVVNVRLNISEVWESASNIVKTTKQNQS